MSEKGGQFLISDTAASDVFVPEDFSEEDRLIGKAAAEFVEGEVRPRLDDIEAGKNAITVELLKQAGRLGLLGADVPEAFGGAGLSKAASTLVTEAVAHGGSFAISFGAHTGIGTWPLLLFGSEEQKRRYLPALASGDLIAAYALTEPEAGSDARGIRATATPSDGGYRLSGEKQWITNAGFADLFTTYAKIGGDQMTAFLVERGARGLEIGPEWQKMGLHGSSTCSVRFDDVPVAGDNVLGEIGRGHVVAFNVLNAGRWKLAAGCLGSCKALLAITASYARQRRQFGKSIAQFPAIQQKLARMAAFTYALESTVYRTSGLLDRALASVSADLVATSDGYPFSRAVGEYAIEASINKVFGSEVLDLVADEAVQVHGGYGYIRGFEVERAYRDARINRIFEGTNEVNRMLIPGTLLRRAMRGELPLLAAVERARQEIMTARPAMAGSGGGSPSDGLAGELARFSDAKKAVLVVAGVGAQKYLARVEEEQEYLLAIGDLVIVLFAWESALLRAQKLVGARRTAEKAGGRATTRAEAVAGHEAAADCARLFGDWAFEQIEAVCRRTLASIEKGDSLQMQLAALRRLLRYSPVDTVAIGRRIAGRMLDGSRG
jgi:alkylation response protein AidB-like acyl-CoA dehydrogenase